MRSQSSRVVQRSAFRKEGGVLRCLSASEQISSPPSVTRVDWHSRDFANTAAAAAAVGEIQALLWEFFSFSRSFLLSLVSYSQVQTQRNQYPIEAGAPLRESC